MTNTNESFPVSTGRAAKLIGVSVVTLNSALLKGTFPAPAKDSSGQYQWVKGDVDRARTALAKG